MNHAKKAQGNRDQLALKLIHSNPAPKAALAQKDRQARWTVAGGAAILAIGFAVSLSEISELGAFYSSIVFFTLWLTLLVGWSAFHELYRGEIKFSLKSTYAIPVLIGLLSTALLFFSVGTSSRVPSMESYWLNASQAFHQNYTLIETPAPALFPFLASLLHSIFGYSNHHVFWINFLACTLLITAIVRFSERVTKDRIYGVMAIVLLASFPLFGLSTTANSPDLLNMLLVALSAYQLFRFFHEPTLARWELSAVLAILAAQCHPSSFLFLIPIGVAGYQHRKRLYTEGANLRTILLPLLCLPVACLVVSNDLLSHPFDLNLFVANLSDAIAFFFNTGAVFPLSSQIFSLFALTGIVFLVTKGKLKAKHDPLNSRAAYYIGLGFVLITMAQYAFELGNIHNLDQQRLVLVYLPLLALCATYPVAQVYQRATGAPVVALLLFANLCYQLPNYTRNPEAKAVARISESATKVRRVTHIQPKVVSNARPLKRAR